LTNAAKQHQLGAFFWWTSWAASTERPGSATTYTNNWPHEALVGNVPTSGAVLWSILSFVGLLAGIGGLAWWYASQEKVLVQGPYPERDPFLEFLPTPSQRATLKYFFVVVILWGVQILMGILTAHYGVDGHGFYGFQLDRYLPYAVTRTWHLQLAIFWIATSWLATGLYVGPAVSGHEPKYQRLGVNVLFGALILVVGGSLAGEWLGIQQRLGNMWFWFGSQGYEYVDLGRVWQILLFVGLVLWLGWSRRLSQRSFARAKTGRCSSSSSSPALPFLSSTPRVSCTVSAVISSPPNIGDGGLFTCGSKASSKYLRLS
jgi:nitric oxide reductase subunit B